MTSRYLWRGALVVVLSLALITPARANTIPSAETIITAVVVVTAALAIVITVVILHESKKDRAITGCVSSGGSGMTIADERNKQVYVLSGNTVGIKPGERMSLKGKKAKSNQTFVWVTTNVTRDFGFCQP